MLQHRYIYIYTYIHTVHMSYYLAAYPNTSNCIPIGKMAGPTLDSETCRCSIAVVLQKEYSYDGGILTLMCHR